MATSTKDTRTSTCACGLQTIETVSCPRCLRTPAECMCVIVTAQEIAAAFWSAPHGGLVKMGSPLDWALPIFLADRGFAPQAARYAEIRDAVRESWQKQCRACHRAATSTCASCRREFCVEDLSLHEHAGVLTLPAEHPESGR